MTSTAAVLPPPRPLSTRRAVRIRRAVVAGYLHGLSARHGAERERRPLPAVPARTR